jgi:flagellar hook protein FlgE
MGSALWAGISGLNASSTEMDVIANNVANVNTIGYKAGKTYFADVLSQSLSGGTSGSMQVGRGVQVTEVGTQFGSGSFETTGNATDVAIDGDGFFMVNDQNSATYYTRAGSFHLDSAGNLIDTNGYKLQGYNFFGGASTTVTDVNLRNVQSAPVSTTIFSVGANLDASTTMGDTFSTTQTVYDTLGEKHSLGVTFRKTEANNMWSFQCALDGVNATAQTYEGLKFDNSTGDLSNIYTGTVDVVTVGGGAGAGTVTLDQPGQVYQTGTLKLTKTGAGDTASDWSFAAAADKGGYANATILSATATAVTVDLDGNGGADLTLTQTTHFAQNSTGTFTITHTETAPVDLSITFAALSNGASIGGGNVVTWDLVGNTCLPITDYASTSVINSLSNDGYASGLLKSLSITDDGKISGFFTNGQTADVGQIVLANFSDPWGLKKMGSNLFGETVTSGPAIMNVPGASGMGNVASNSLEMSNTDIATEFINMITAQKSYSANARVITTEDQMLTELINIKR